MNRLAERRPMRVMTSWDRGALAVAFSSALLGCGGDDHGRARADSGADAGVDSGPALELQLEEPMLPEEPAPPAQAVLTPCPTGWREVSTPERGTVCEPWPESGPADCADDEAHFPGEPGCVRIGSACPRGDWAEDLPAGARVLFVRAGATGGDGSRGAPFGTIAAATAVASAGTVVALAKGTFDEAVQLREGVTLWGACVSQSVISTSGSAAAWPAVVESTGEATALRNLRVTGDRVCVSVSAGAMLDLQDVVLSGCRRRGLVADSRGSAIGRNLAIRDIDVTDPADATFGQGVVFLGGSAITLERAVIERASRTGITIGGAGTTAALRGVAVRRSALVPSGGGGRGFFVAEGASLEAIGVALERNPGAGVVAVDAGSTVQLTDVRIGGTVDAPASAYRIGIWASDGARVEARRAFVDGYSADSVRVEGAGTEVDLEDVVAARQAGCSADEGAGMLVTDTATLLAQRLRILDGCGDATLVGNASSATLTDLVASGGRLEAVSGASLRVTRADIRDSTSDGVFGSESSLAIEDLQVLGAGSGYGVLCGFGSRLELRRAFVGGTGRAAVTILRGTTAVVEDLTVRDALGPDSGESGYGLWVSSESQVEARRLLLERTGRAGVALDGRARLTLSDVTVLDTQVHPLGVGGRGINVQDGASADVTRARIEGNREQGVGAFETGSTLVLRELRVTGTAARTSPCSVDLCGGIGVGSLGGASIEISRFIISGNEVAGLQLATGGTMDLHEGLVADHPIGASVDTEGFDTSRLTDRVVFRDNRRPIDSAMLPVPEPIPPPPLPDAPTP